MGTTDDPTGYRNDFRDELRRLDDLPHEGDARAIRTWANRLDDAPSTKANLVCNLRTLSRRALAGGYPPLTEMENENDFYELHGSLRAGTNPDVKDDGLAESTLRNTRKAARQFFRHGLGVAWAEEITVGKPEKGKVTEDDVFNAQEVERLFDAAHNPRDKALMGTLLATGQRISAVLSLRIRDVDLDGPTGFINLNDDAIGLKGAAGKRPLLWATDYVTNWLDVHPCKRNPGAALFCTLPDQNHRDRETDADPLSPWGVNQQLRRIGKRADVDKPVNPHTFRHSAVTRMVRQGVPEQQIKWTVGWHEDSSQFERYAHLHDDEHIAAILEHHGIEADEYAIGAPELDDCPSCGAQLSAWVNPQACPGCGCSLSHNADAIREGATAIREHVRDRVFDPSASLTPEDLAYYRILDEVVSDEDALALDLHDDSATDSDA